jgi:hypothetical protein
LVEAACILFTLQIEVFSLNLYGEIYWLLIWNFQPDFDLNVFVFNFIKSPEKEVVPIVEVTVTPEIKPGEESGIVPETTVKSKKKSKKKSATKSAEPEVPVATETTIETQEVTQPAPVVEVKVEHSKQSEVEEEGKTSIMKWSVVVSSSSSPFTPCGA